MIEVHRLTDEARERANEIQDALNRSDYVAVRNEIKVMLNHKPNDDTIESLISGATFTVNLLGISYTDNSLLHIAVLVRVDSKYMQQLLKCGIKYSSELHQNSLCLTLAEYAEELQSIDDDILVHLYKDKEDPDILRAITAALHSENAIVDANTITVDMAPQMPGAERSMFNSSTSIREQVQYFITQSLCPSAIAEYDGTMITFTDPNIVRLRWVENGLPSAMGTTIDGDN